MFAVSLLMMPINTAGINALRNEDISHGTAIMNFGVFVIFHGSNLLKNQCWVFLHQYSWKLPLKLFLESQSYTMLVVVYAIRMFAVSLLMMPINTAGINALRNGTCWRTSAEYFCTNTHESYH
jgi:hypothetical protein